MVRAEKDKHFGRDMSRIQRTREEDSGSKTEDSM